MVTIVPFGPQHPILPEPIKFKLELEEETVVGADFEIGFMHRGIEKGMEQDYMKSLFLCERVCGICSTIHAVTYLGCLEKAADIEVPERARYIRTILLELERLHSHMLWLGVAADTIGFQNLFMLCWRERELVMDTLEALTGNRVNMSDYVPGGVRNDITPKLEKYTKKNLEEFTAKALKIGKMLTSDYTTIKRLKGVAPLSKKQIKRYDIVGPNARASGVNNDARCDGYEVYDKLDFEPILLDGCDNLARVLVRYEETVQAIGLIEKCFKQMEKGPVLNEFKGGISGEASFRAEAPRGELFYYIKGNGTKKLERCKIRTPTIANVAVVPELLQGVEFGDVPVSVLSFDPCMSCQDR